MIGKGTQHDNGAKLAAYLTKDKDGETAELWQLRGFAADDIKEAFRSVHVLAEATRAEQPFFHVQVRLPEGENLTRQQWEKTANRIERMLGLKDQPRAIAFHIDKKTSEEHMHVAWSRIDAETMQAIPLPFFKDRLKKVCRELELNLGLQKVSSQRDSKIEYAPTRDEDQQARRLGVDVHKIRETIRVCYDRSDCGQSFKAALEHEGVILAQGDRRDYLAVYEGGGYLNLGKKLLGATAAQVRKKLADIDREKLPSLERAREQVLTRDLAQVQKQIEAEKQAAPIWDRDAANRAWEEAVINAGIENGNSASGREKTNDALQPAPRPEPELNKTAGTIRLAYNLTDGPQAFREFLRQDGLTMANVTAQDIQERDSARRQENRFAAISAWDMAEQGFRDAEQSVSPAPAPRRSGRLSDHAREGDVVILDKWGNVYELNQRTTGDTRRDAQAFVAGIGPLPSVRQVRSDLEEHRQRPIHLPTGPQHGGLVAQQMWALRRVQNAGRQRHHEHQRSDEQRGDRDHAEKQKADAGEVDIERYRADPEYRRQVHQAQSFKTPEERKADRENNLRALLEQQDRQR
jgi:Relaxase/Mobilisation nuclease domain